jgi:RNA polymerase sigma factor (sigma-70 family)
MNKTISDSDLREALSKSENIDMIHKVCYTYRKSLPPSVLKSCGEAAVWRCLQSHKEGMGQRFTSSLYRFLHWECLREIHQNSTKLDTLEISEHEAPENVSMLDRLILKECLESLPETERKIVIARFIENRTLTDIGNMFNYSRQGIRNILFRSLTKMKKIMSSGV